MKKVVHKKQPCECSHGKMIHHAARTDFKERVRNPCNFPGCKGRDYKPEK